MLSFQQVESKLKGYPPEVLADYKKFTEEKNLDSLHRFVLGTIAFLIDSDEKTDFSTLPDSANLRTDLNVESITIAETIFILEDVFEIEISNEDVLTLNTVGDLKSFLNKVAA